MSYSNELLRHTTFRDFLRNNPEAVKKYSKVKEEAAKLFPDNIDQYIEYKTPCIKELYLLFTILSKTVYPLITTSISIIGFAESPSTEVLPTCSIHKIKSPIAFTSSFFIHILHHGRSRHDRRDDGAYRQVEKGGRA